jgi:site-specific DNA-methyltransferase (adenine-specific)
MEKHERDPLDISVDGPAALAAGQGIVLSDSATLLRSLPDDCIDLIYTDPPFNTGKVQRLSSIKASADGPLSRTGFQGQAGSYETVSVHEYRDDMPFGEYLEWLSANLREMQRVLAPAGSLYLHLDFHAVHYAKVLLDDIFGADRFLNEIIWAYDYGGRARNKWPRKHDNILWYAKGDSWTFNRDDIDRLPYMAPGLVGPEKAARGKLPTDTWFMTIVPTNSRDRTGWPTQKPLPLVERIIRASSNPGDMVADFFSGSGTTAVAADRLGRRFLVGDADPVAIAIAQRRVERGRRGLPYQVTRAELARAGGAGGE